MNSRPHQRGSKEFLEFNDFSLPDVLWWVRVRNDWLLELFKNTDETRWLFPIANIMHPAPSAPSQIATAITAATKPALLRLLLLLQRLALVNRASCQSRTCQSLVLSITHPALSLIAPTVTADTKPALLRPLLPLPLIPRPLLQLPLVLQPLVVVVIVRGAALSGCGQNDWLLGIYECIKNLPAFFECFLIITLATCPALPLSQPLP